MIPRSPRRGCGRARGPRVSCALPACVSSESGLTSFSTTSFSATSNIRDARVSEPWLSCSTAAATISWKRFPTSSWSCGKRDDAADRLRRGRPRGRERLLDGLGRQREGPRRDRPPERPDDLAGRHVHSGGAEASRAPARSSPSERAAIAATARIWDDERLARRLDHRAVRNGRGRSAGRRRRGGSPDDAAAPRATGAPAVRPAPEPPQVGSAPRGPRRSMSIERCRRSETRCSARAAAVLAGRAPRGGRRVGPPCRRSISTGAERTLSVWPSRPRFCRSRSRSAGGQNDEGLLGEVLEVSAQRVARHEVVLPHRVELLDRVVEVVRDRDVLARPRNCAIVQAWISFAARLAGWSSRRLIDSATISGARLSDR